MSDDEADEELLELLRKSLGLQTNSSFQEPKIKVLKDAEFIYNNATDVALDMQSTKRAAAKIYELMQKKSYSTRDWRTHELHPKSRDESTVGMIFLMDLLNFSFWSEQNNREDCFAVEYRGQNWTGYWSLIAAIQKALDDGIPITEPSFWNNETKCSDEVLKSVFRSSTDEEIPLLRERIHCVREAGRVLQEVRGPNRLILGSADRR